MEKRFALYLGSNTLVIMFAALDIILNKDGQTMLHIMLSTVVIISSGIGVAVLWRAQRRLAVNAHRKKYGLCVKCNYDLRMHATGDKCPECGTPIPARSSEIPIP